VKLLFAIAWRNLWRNKRRSILSILAVAFAVTIMLFMMGWQQGSYKDMIQNAVQVHTGYLQLQQTGYLKNKDIDKALRNVDKASQLIASTENVVAQAPRINAPALASFQQRTSAAMIFGIIPDQEAQVSTIGKVVKEGKYLENGDLEGVLVGKILAKNLHLGLGDRVAFLGQGADGSMAAGLLTVRGLFSTGNPELDRSTMFANIDRIGEAFSMYGGVHEIAVVIDELKNLDKVIVNLTGGIQTQNLTGAVALSWDEVLPGVKQGIDMDWETAQVTYFILMMIVGFGIMNTFLMSFLERTREFGVLMSIGMRQWQIARLVFFEAMLLTAVGIIVGLGGGTAVTLYFQWTGITIPGTEEMMAEYGMSATQYPVLALWLMRRVSLQVGAIAAIVALYPTIKVLFLRPVEAMRSI
jgi:putative ABC transport system permease protein